MCVANCIPSLSQNTYINFTSLVNSTRVFGRITDSLIQIQAMEKKIEEIGAKENRRIDDDEEDQDEAGNVLDNESQDMAGKNHHLSTYEKTYVPGRGIERYNNSFKNLLPIRRKTKYEETISMDSSGLFSSLGISWFSKFMYKAYSGGLKMEELPKLSPYDTCDYNTDRLELLWKSELAKRGPKMASFSKVAWRFCRTRIIISCFIMMCSFASTFLTYTLFMRKLLEYIQSGGGSYGEGLKWALLLFAVGTIRVLLVISTWALNQRTGLRLRSACLTLLYRKIIRVNNLGNKNIGEMINVFSNDAQRIFEMTYFGPPIIEAPIFTVYTVLYVLWIFQPMGLLGIVVFLLFYPLVYAVSRLIGYLLTKAMNVSDVRVRLMNEILDCVKLIKMYAWEKRFSKDLLDTREKERRILLNATYCSIANASMTLIAPVISTIITILAHVSGGYNLTAAQVFPYVSFLESRFRVSLNIFQRGLDSIVLAGISFERIKNLLLLEETECSILKPILKSQAVAINNGTFAYNNSSYDKEQSSQANGTKRTNASTGPADKSEQEKLNKPTENAEHVQVLFDVSFEAEKGKLIGICGTVGSGKSSLLLAVLGQLRVSEGQVMRDGSCAYVSQQAWISNATLRENILFGAKFDRSRYDKTIYACNLSQDIDMMPGGDQTEIGEKGVNLSGGQKQRVALARALYADRDIYLLDDPLSAVDSRVGSYIFDNLILGALRQKTVLFVTHQIQYLNRCDDIYMMQNGRIIEHGTHDELMKLENEYATMVAAISSDDKTEDETFADQKIESLPRLQVNRIPLNEEGANTTSRYNVEKSDTPDTQLIVAEYLQQGNIKADAYHAYIVAAGGYCFCFIVFLTFVANSASTALSSWWLAKWIKAGGGNATILRNNETILSDNVNDNPDFFYYQTIYASSIGIIVLSAVLYTFVFTRATIGASTRLHNDLFRKVISSPMRFFDTTPSGRIQHLFSRDMDEVDKKLPGTVNNCIESVLRIFLSALMVCTVFPWFLLPMVLILVVYYFISTRFGAAIRDLKRMDNKMRAPVISFVTATVQGLSTIHAFGVEDDFRAKFVDLFGENGKFLFMYSISILWLMLRIDCLSVAMIGFTAISVVVFQDQVPPALAGLALAYASQVTGVMAYSITLISETEVRFTSVERINYYIKILQGESRESKSTVELKPTWPKAAEIKFKNVCMAYGDGAPPILKNVSFTVHAGEKIGIVGRTGSGKSSLTVALFRLVELAEGKIEIDDVDISEISLNQLRTKLSIIPQDPVLFSGTIRSNLDPFKLYTDVEIWEALEKTELKNKVRLIPGQLDASVGSGGDNMSVGERQLLCLSRALLRNSKILILDEATAAVDRETEIAVQNTVQREFASCTILTIAHRLQTVSSLSRVLVMNDGKVLEFDTPSNLLGDPSSEFSKMMAATKQAEIQ